MYNVTSLMSSSSPVRMIPTNRRHISLCAVCGDKASGKHYGVMSCDGCRGFFKRSVRRKIEYKCKGDSACQVDVNRRNQCQACRFQRCLTVKMKPSAVQNERAPRHGTKRAMPTPSLPRVQCWTPPTIGYVAESSPMTMPFGIRNLSMNNTSSPIWSTTRMFIPQQSINISKCSTSSDPTLSDLSNNDETQISLDVTGGDEQYQSGILCEAASCVLIESIRWLYTVPTFKALDEYDQLILIEQSWSTIFLLASAEMKKFPDLNDHELYDDDNQYFLFQSYIKELYRYSIDPAEYIILKLITIFSNSTNEVHDRLSIDRHRNNAVCLLTEYTRNSQYRRMAQLMTLLSNIQEKISRIDLDKLFFQNIIDINRTSMKQILHNFVRHHSTTTH